jgi:NADH-quinone oxidoreductase subunit H
MALGWKILIPFSIIWLLLVATVRALRQDNHSPVVYAVAGVVLILFVLLVTFWDNGYQKHLARVSGAEPVTEKEEEEDEWDYDEDGELVKIERPKPAARFPVPPLDLPHYHGLELATASSTGSEAVSGDATGVTKEVTGA